MTEKKFYFNPVWQEQPFIGWLRTGEYNITYGVDLNAIDDGFCLCSLSYNEHSLEINAWGDDWNYFGYGKPSGKINLEYIYCYPIYRKEDRQSEDKIRTVIHDERYLTEDVDIEIFKADNWKELLEEKMFGLLKKCMNNEAEFLDRPAE